MIEQITDPYDKKSCEIEGSYNFEINKFYQGVTQYYNKIAQEANKTIINWIFALNTGGLVILIPFIFKYSGCQLTISIIAALLYFLGMSSIYISIRLEKNNFEDLSANSEKHYREFQNGIITGRQYFNIVQNPPDNQWPFYFENTAAICWLIGTLAGILLLVISKVCN